MVCKRTAFRIYSPVRRHAAEDRELTLSYRAAEIINATKVPFQVIYASETVVQSLTYGRTYERAASNISAVASVGSGEASAATTLIFAVLVQERCARCR